MGTDKPKRAVPTCKKCGKQHYSFHPCPGQAPAAKKGKTSLDHSGQPLVGAKVQDTQV